ncbi:MAG: exodeoxyribonuclease VII small subunit [Verrucomicrobiales bacterium]|jgi:exodeoxyribonuclease VII small subunit
MTTADDITDEPQLDYSSAVAELDEILAELEDESLNVDILADRVKRASLLITFCRTRITSAKTQVEQIVADLEQLGDAE